MIPIEKKYRFQTKRAVRDYEVDYQGIVNNANYLHYMEHTRHEFCLAEGLSFAEMHQKGIDPVVCRADISFRNPLSIGDTMISCLNVMREGPRFVFLQDIYKEYGTLAAQGKIEIACMENGRLSRGDVLSETFKI